ncbi:heterocyst frequency control protein PatD [Phormidium sp. CCY1219]|jgi:hypothetical protein|uniref:heterocyst frequency control protein PatD n=1 Tax=Phormidium sp. CCY1219 TaxID=2886104 RepID=UPI002D1E5065|nr:heterocyst frequency control protein PatD [Phormidium sp. CCY1219]MEB3830626.1 heterocyst frequency control protein PatD [Phormidium sp. CCY1219]
MLPEVHYQRYREFKDALLRLQERVDAPSVDKTALKAAAGDLQHVFQEQILPLPMDALDPADVSRVQSYRTEMHKQQRLLGNDALFLLSARQPTTVQQRLDAIRDRLQRLIRYCDALLEVNNS